MGSVAPVATATILSTSEHLPLLMLPMLRETRLPRELISSMLVYSKMGLVVQTRNSQLLSSLKQE